MPSKLLRLLQDHGDELHRLLMRLTLRAEVAEDLLQELFLRLDGLDSFRSADHPLAFARRVAIHLAFDWRRSAARRARLISAAARPELVPPPWVKLAEHEQAERILNQATQLSPLAQQAFVLRYVAGESYANIAAAIGRTPHQARGLCHAAVKEIRRQIDARESIDEPPLARKTGAR